MKNSSPRVSVFVITYNQESLALEAVRSCIEQDYDNLEVVVSDDGSTDATVPMLEELHARHPRRMKLIANPVNAGITRNCNIALANCGGELIAFMGGDDVLYPNKISRQVDAFRQNPDLVFCYHPCDVLTEGGVTGVVGNRRKDLVRNFHEIIANYGANIPGPVPMVARRAVPPGGFNEALAVASDWMFFIDVCSKGEIVRLDEVLSAYRKHGGNVGHRIHSYAGDFLKTVDLVKQKYREPGASAAADRAARRFLLGIIYRCITESDFGRLDGYLAEYRRRGGALAPAIRLVSRSAFAPALFARLRGELKKYF